MTKIDELVQKMLDLDEDTLKAQLGISAQAIAQDPTARSASIESLDEALSATPRGSSLDSADVDFGEKFFNKLNIKSYDLMCGELLDAELTAKIAASYKENSDKAAAFLAPTLASQLNLPFSIAAIVAVLIIKTLVSASSTMASATSETICEVWKKKLSIEPCDRINQTDNDPAQRRALEEAGARGTVTLQDAPGCSTAVVRLLDKQLIEEMNKIEPNCLVSFANLNVDMGEGVHPFLQLPAKEALAQAIRDRGQKLVVNSAYRTIAQQLFLFTRGSSCGYDRVAPPGSSNHESGLALDIEDPEGWSSFLENYGWYWPAFANDLCHLEYQGSDKQDISGTAVLAFQKLWNRHNPNEQIDEDGAFGPATEEKLNKSPVEGF